MVLRSKNVGFLEFSDSYAKKISDQNSHFFKNFVFDFLEKVEYFFNFFFTKRNFRPRPIFWFLFHQNRTTRKYFLRGCTTVGGGGVCAPAMKKFPKSNFNWNSSDFLYFLPRKLATDYAIPILSG